jgi:SAM-dependent methyltransferase
MSPQRPFTPAEYWRTQLTTGDDLSTVGIPNLGLRYNQTLYRIRTECLDRVLEATSIDPRGKRVLDVGCGTGFWMQYWQSRGARQVAGVDISPAAIARLKRTFPNSPLMCADIGIDSLEDLGQFDIVSCFDVLFHLLQDEPWHHGVREVVRRVTNHGVVILAEHLGPRAYATDAMKARPRTAYEMVFAGLGVQIVGFRPIFYAALAPTRLSPPFQILGLLYWRLLSHMVRQSGLVSDFLAHIMPGLERFLSRAFPKWGPSTHYVLVKVADATPGTDYVG